MEFICFFLVVVLVGWLLIQVLTADNQKPEEPKRKGETIVTPPEPELILPRPEAPAGVDGMRSNKKCSSCGASLGRKSICDYCGDGQ